MKLQDLTDGSKNELQQKEIQRTTAGEVQRTVKCRKREQRTGNNDPDPKLMKTLSRKCNNNRTTYCPMDVLQQKKILHNVKCRDGEKRAENLNNPIPSS